MKGIMNDTGKTPAVSIVIPAYRVSQYIAEALDSVFAQTCDDYEVIVVNDGSPDTEKLEKALEPYMDRIVYIRQTNQGVSAARNTAIRAARGRYLAFLDGDDTLEPDYLEVQIGIMLSDPTIDVVYPDAVIFGGGARTGRNYMEICPSNGEVTFESMVNEECQVMISSLAKREVVERAGMFDPEMRSSEDFDLWLRIARQGSRIVYHRKVLVRRREHAGSLSSDPVWMYENAVRVLDKMRRTQDLSSRELEALRRAKQRFRAMLQLYQGKKAFFRGDVTRAIEELKNANSYLKSRKMSFVLLMLKVAPKFLLGAYKLRDRFVIKADTKI